MGQYSATVRNEVLIHTFYNMGEPWKLCFVKKASVKDHM